jgi:alpha-1,2-mannosyltransferase
MWLAASYHRSGNEAAGFSVCAITGLLISPISWTHHWVLAVPALLIGAVTLYRTREYRHLAVNLLGAAALAAVAIVGWSHMARDVPATNWLHMSAQGIVFSEIYVVIGLAVLALAAGCRFQGESPGFRQAGGRAISAGEL